MLLLLVFVAEVLLYCVLCHMERVGHTRECMVDSVKRYVCNESSSGKWAKIHSLFGRNRRTETVSDLQYHHRDTELQSATCREIEKARMASLTLSSFGGLASANAVQATITQRWE